VYRAYWELENNLRIKPRSPIKRDKPDALAVPAEINQVCSMDFMCDSLKDGRSIRTFNVIDDCNRESLAMNFDISLPAQRVIRSLQQWLCSRDYLGQIEREIVALTNHIDACKRLTAIEGSGPKNALALYTELGDGRSFANGRSAVACIVIALAVKTKTGLFEKVLRRTDDSDQP
jgi:transposase